jgi:hypothetical protein
VDVQSWHFLGPQVLIKRWRSITKFPQGSNTWYMQRLHTTFHLQKYLATKVNIMGQWPCVVFLSGSGGKNDSYNGKKSLYVLPNLTFATTMVINFNLWMSRDGVDIFA